MVHNNNRVAESLCVSSLRSQAHSLHEYETAFRWIKKAISVYASAFNSIGSSRYNVKILLGLFLILRTHTLSRSLSTLCADYLSTPITKLDSFKIVEQEFCNVSNASWVRIICWVVFPSTLASSTFSISHFTFTSSPTLTSIGICNFESSTKLKNKKSQCKIKRRNFKHIILYEDSSHRTITVIRKITTKTAAHFLFTCLNVYILKLGMAHIEREKERERALEYMWFDRRQHSLKLCAQWASTVQQLTWAFYDFILCSKKFSIKLKFVSAKV